MCSNSTVKLNGLRSTWAGMNSGDASENFCVLVIPSLSVDEWSSKKIDGFLHYEERLLCFLSLLNLPHVRLVYVTSHYLASELIEYCFHHLVNVPISNARERTTFMSVEDLSLLPLTRKILDRPRFIERLKQIIPKSNSLMYCFSATDAEESLALELQISLMAASCKLSYLGTKEGSREVFRSCDLTLIPGSELLYCESEILGFAHDLKVQYPNSSKILIKLNDAFLDTGMLL